jgi:hypothetical protein
VLDQIPLKFCHDINFAFLFFVENQKRSRKGAEIYPSGETLLHAALHTVISVGPFAEFFVIGFLLFGLTDQFLNLHLSLSLSLSPFGRYISHPFLYLLYVN